jgi:acylpyruvate hydrolase
VSKFSMGAILGNHGNAAVVVIGNDVIRLNSLLAATGNEDLPGGFGLSEMLDHWDVWLPRLKSVVGALENNVSIRNACEIEAVSEVTSLPPIQRPRKLICMGTNYAGHAAEVSSDPLKAPYSFIKTTSNTLRGSHATITLLDIAQMNDWEVELTVVNGRAARHVEEGRAMDYVAGYTIINDVSARDWVASSPKFLGIDWVVGKSIDGYAPIASMCGESFVTQNLPVPTGLANRLLPAAAFVLCTQTSKLGRIQS